ncbi:MULTISPECIES: BON domain-containing protein [Streptomyces]|uniref:BON domain-containing protein n=1 Tax=Streptomyces TaxID=1883 RepID=UPI001587D065|nr:BON domain-containing protein [Streptomyces sp. CAI-85]MBO7940078.1 BON domain-containing protein [Streptomyces sp. S9]NUV60271.1 BON domain-containing protein [Streptomyces sp. CAI-85]
MTAGEYRVAHLVERLAEGHPAALGIRVETRGETVLVTGTVPSAECRDDILGLVHETLPGVPVHGDLVVADTTAPDHAEELP